VVVSPQMPILNTLSPNSFLPLSPLSLYLLTTEIDALKIQVIVFYNLYSFCNIEGSHNTNDIQHSHF
jgi:hypothetical protein